MNCAGESLTSRHGSREPRGVGLRAGSRAGAAGVRRSDAVVAEAPPLRHRPMAMMPPTAATWSSYAAFLSGSEPSARYSRHDERASQSMWTFRLSLPARADTKLRLPCSVCGRRTVSTSRRGLRSVPGREPGAERHRGDVGIGGVLVAVQDAGVAQQLHRSEAVRLRGSPRAPRIGGTASSRGRAWVTSCRLPPVSVTASGVPCRSTIRRCLEPGRARSTGEGPTRYPLCSPRSCKRAAGLRARYGCCPLLKAWLGSGVAEPGRCRRRRCGDESSRPGRSTVRQVIRKCEAGGVI